MSRRIREHIRSNVIGYLALFVAMSGTAYAVDGPLPGQNQVGSADIINNDVYSADVRNDTLSGGGLAAADLAPNAVGTSEVAGNAIGSAKVAPDSLGAADLGSGSVGTSEVAPDSLGAADLGPDSVGTSEVAPDSLGAGDLGPDSVGTDEVANNSLRLRDTAVAVGVHPNDFPGFSGCFTIGSIISGVQVGDYTIVVPDGLENGLVTYGMTSDTAGQARWRLCTTGGTVDPAAHNYTLIVFRFA
jgi:hypothetical protein